MATNEESFNKLIGRRIRFLLEHRDITIAEFADEMHVEYDTMRKYLSGARKIPPELLYKMSQRLCCMVDFIYTGNLNFVCEAKSNPGIITNFVVQADMIADPEERKKLYLEAIIVFISRM